MKKIYLLLLLGLLLVGTVSAVWNHDLDGGLISYYKLDETSGSAIDSLGINNLTRAGNPTNVTGIIESAKQGSLGNFFYNPSASGLTAGTNTISFWAKGVSNGNFFFFSNRQIGSTAGMRFFYDGATIYPRIDSDGYPDSTGPSYAWTYDTSWHHWLAVFNSPNIQFWFDGTNVANGTWDGRSVAGTNWTMLDFAQADTGTFIMDEVGLWNRTLTGAEITELYNSGNGITYEAEVPETTTNPSVILDAPTNYANYTVTSGTTYPLIFNITTKDYNPAGTIVNLTLYLDGVLNQTNDTICTNCTYNFTLGIPVGKHNWSVIAFNNNSLSNQSETRDFWIKDGVGTCDVYFNTTSPITYPNRFTVYTNCSSDYTLYINGTSISNGTSINYGAGYYNLSVVRTNQDDYTYTYDEQFFTINKYTTSLSITGTTPIVYGTAGDYEGINCPSEIECKLYRTPNPLNPESIFTEVSNPDTSVLAVGEYIYIYNTSGNSNYTSDSVGTVLQGVRLKVSSFDDGCSIFFNTTSPLPYPNTFTVWTNCSTGTLRRNDTEILNNSEQTLTFGTYNFSFQRTDTENYTTSYLDEYFTISDSTPPTINVTVPQTSNYRFFTNYTDGIYGYFPYTSYFINWTTYDDNLDTCWFENISALNSMIRVNETVTCNTNATIVYPVNTGNTLRFYANDTSGNIASVERTNITNDIRIDRSSHSYINTTTQGDTINFWMNVRKGVGDTLENVTFVLNNTDYPITDFSGSNFSTNVTIPNITGSTTYYWEFDFGEGFFNSTIYNLTVDSPPVITINLPTNTTYYLTSSSPNVTINFSVADNNFANATYNVNGTNMTVLTDETQESLNLSDGTYTLQVWAYDDVMFSDYETITFTVVNVPIINIGESYSASTYETNNETFYLNISTITGVSSISAFLVYNGTYYPGETSCNGSACQIHKEIDIPLLDNKSLSSENKTFYWDITLLGGFGTVTDTTTVHTQNVSNIIFQNCESGFNTLNFSIYNETDSSLLNSTFKATFYYWLGTGTVKDTYNFSGFGNSSYLFCFNYNITYKTSSDIVINSSTDERDYEYTEESHSSSSSSQSIYIPDDSLAEDIIIEVKNQGLVPLPNIVVNISRFYPDTNEYKLVENKITDVFGQISAKLIRDDVKYVFNFYDLNGTLLYTSGKVTIICRSTICVVPFIIQESSDYLDRYSNLTLYQYSLSFDNSTNTFTFSWSDQRNENARERLEVVRYKFNESTVVCNTTSTDIVSSLTCDVGDDSASYTAQVFRLVPGENEIRISYLQVIVGDYSSTFGVEGLFWVFILLMICVGIGVYDPKVGAVLYGVGFIFMGILKIIYMPLPVFFANTLLVILFVWAVKT